MSDAMAGTTFPDVPASPEREIRRNHAKALRDRGRSLGEIANILGVPRYTVQDDLRDVPKAPPLSVRFPPDLERRARTAAAQHGQTLSQFVVEAVADRLAGVTSGPPSIVRLPDKVREAVALRGAEYVLDAVEHYTKHRERAERWNETKRARRRDGGAGPETGA